MKLTPAGLEGHISEVASRPGGAQPCETLHVAARLSRHYHRLGQPDAQRPAEPLPDAGEWGYHRSGPAQLFLALLADATGDDKLAQRLYQRFKREVVAGFDRDRFLITQAEVRSWVAHVLSPEPPDVDA